MKTNRIKWSEEMERRCMKRIMYLPANNNSAMAKRFDTPERPNESRNNNVTADNLRSIGVGEIMECKLMIM